MYALTRKNIRLENAQFQMKHETMNCYLTPKHRKIGLEIVNSQTIFYQDKV